MCAIFKGLSILHMFDFDMQGQSNKARDFMIVVRLES